MALTMSSPPEVEVRVECHSGYRANERPIAILLNDRRLEIVEVLDRWYEGSVTPGRPAIDYFKVRTENGAVALLRYNSLFDTWVLTRNPGTI
jgi:hypothetical protein